MLGKLDWTLVQNDERWFYYSIEFGSVQSEPTGVVMNRNQVADGSIFTGRPFPLRQFS